MNVLEETLQQLFTFSLLAWDSISYCTFSVFLHLSTLSFQCSQNHLKEIQPFHRTQKSNNTNTIGIQTRFFNLKGGKVAHTVSLRISPQTTEQKKAIDSSIAARMWSPQQWKREGGFDGHSFILDPNSSPSPSINKKRLPRTSKSSLSGCEVLLTVIQMKLYHQGIQNPTEIIAK